MHGPTHKGAHEFAASCNKRCNPAGCQGCEGLQAWRQLVVNGCSCSSLPLSRLTTFYCAEDLTGRSNTDKEQIEDYVYVLEYEPKTSAKRVLEMCLLRRQKG